MKDSTSPVICVTCQRPFPAGLKSEDSPRYLGQYGLLPTSDDDNNFVNEARNILRYIRAASYCARYAVDVEHDISQEMYGLIQELSEEAQRRVDLAGEAMDEVWKRTRDKASPGPREEG